MGERRAAASEPDKRRSGEGSMSRSKPKLIDDPVAPFRLVTGVPYRVITNDHGELVIRTASEVTAKPSIFVAVNTNLHEGKESSRMESSTAPADNVTPNTALEELRRERKKERGDSIMVLLDLDRPRPDHGTAKEG
jgi:hypothetical protein